MRENVRVITDALRSHTVAKAERDRAEGREAQHSEERRSRSRDDKQRVHRRRSQSQ